MKVVLLVSEKRSHGGSHDTKHRECTEKLGWQASSKQDHRTYQNVYDSTSTGATARFPCSHVSAAITNGCHFDVSSISVCRLHVGKARTLPTVLECL